MGRPLVLALNMYDIAERQGIRIDLEGLSKALGVPVVTTVAVRKRGSENLLKQVDVLAEAGRSVATFGWHEPNAAEIREAHRQAEQIMRTHVKPPLRPDTWTGRLDGLLLHPVAGTAILMAILFLMFQAVFSWATPVMDAIDAGFGLLARRSRTMCRPACCRAFLPMG